MLLHRQVRLLPALQMDEGDLGNLWRLFDGPKQLYKCPTRDENDGKDVI
jgi:hypothetical protein